jgi:putative membrane protein
MNPLARTAVALAACLPCLALAQVGEADKAFLMKAAQANLAEVETGRLARQKAADPEVREFGQRMEHDHAKALRELQALAQKHEVALPEAPDEAHQALAFQLSRASGRPFDLAYVKNAGVADHKAAETLFEAGSRSSDAGIAAFAKKALADIRHHLAMAQKLSARL